MNTTQLCITALLLGSSAVPQAAEQTMAPVVVTATRTAQSADETLASVTVIDRKEIEQSQANSVVELIQSHTVGIELTRNGGLGTNTSLLMRGTNSNHVLVLIDGVRVNSAIDGSFKWANLPLEQIERIEVVRGPRSTLYGSDAIGGVVQIFTRKGEGFHAMAGGGSYNTARAEIGTGGALGAGSYHINAGYLKSDGFSAAKPGTYGYEPDNDGYRNTNLGAGIKYPLGNSGKLTINLLHSAGDVDTDAGASTQRNDSASVALDLTSSERWQQNMTLGHAEDHYETNNGYIVHSLRDNIGWQHDLQLSDASLFTAGLDYMAENGENEGASGYNENTRNSALFAQYQWGSDSVDLLLGARSDDHSSLGRHNTGNITLGGHAGRGRLYASYASAFNAPTFLQLYYPYGGNAALLPEESISTELGYRLGNFKTNLFDTRIDNLINWDSATSGFSNVNRARIQGLELEYMRQVGSWRLNGGLTLQKTEDMDSGERLNRRAEKKLFFTASGPLDSHSNMGIETSYTGPRKDGSVELASYTLLNLTGEYRVTRQWSLSGRIENLLGEEYELASGYNTPGRSAYANINFKI